MNETEEILNDISHLENKLDDVYGENPRRNALKNSVKNKNNNPNKKDVNDYPTPVELVNIIINGVIEKNIFGNVNMEDGIDLCCNERNKKFDKGLTLNGSTGIEPKLDGDSLKQNWNQLASFGWIASPYKKKPGDTNKYEHGIQGSFAKKAFEESNNGGMKIIALFQDSCVNTNWFQKYIYTNKNCQPIFMEGRLKYPEMYYGSPNYGNVLVFFGVESNSLLPDDFEYFRLAIRHYDEITSNKRKMVRKEKRKQKLVENNQL